MNDTPGLSCLLVNLERRTPLDQADRDAVLSLPITTRSYDPGSYVAREGMTPDRATVLVDGLAFRQKQGRDGARQIVSIQVPGDIVDLEAALLQVADYSVQALTHCEVAEVPASAIRELVESHPRVSHALWVATLADASIAREWVLNVGRRPARERIAHLICEIALRLKSAGLGDESGYRLPMTQAQIADATGLTPVHVNRCLKSLEADGYIERRRRRLAILDWEHLEQEAGFSALYLHLEQAA